VERPEDVIAANAKDARRDWRERFWLRCALGKQFDDQTILLLRQL
jgi:hypothetical protein